MSMLFGSGLIWLMLMVLGTFVLGQSSDQLSSQDGVGRTLTDDLDHRPSNSEIPKPPGSRSVLDVLDSPPAYLEGMNRLPDALFLRNEANQPIFIPRVRYEEFEKYLRERSGSSSTELPAAVLDTVQISGAVRPEQDFAALKLELTMSVTDASPKLYRLPLGLKNMNWTCQPRGKNGKRNLIVVQSNGEGVVWFIETDGSSSYSLELEAIVKVDRTFSESSLRLDLPEAATQIKLDLPSSELNVEWFGAAGEVLETKPSQKTTEVLIRGRGGLGQVQWRDRSQSRSFAAIEVESSTRLVLQESSDSFVATSRLRLLSDSRVGQRILTIQLPPRARWTPNPIGNSSPNWLIERIEPKPEALGTTNSETTEEPAGDRLRLTLSDRNRLSVEEVLLDWTYSFSPNAEEQVNFEGILIEEASRHESRWSLVLPLSAQFIWSTSAESNLIERTPADDMAEFTEHVFQSYRQPFRISGIFRREDNDDPKLQVDYAVRFLENRLEMEAKVQFAYDIQSPFEFIIEGGEWVIESAAWDQTGNHIPWKQLEPNSMRLSIDPFEAIDEQLERPTRAPESSVVLRASRPLESAEMKPVIFNLLQFRMSPGDGKPQRGQGSLSIDYGPWQPSAVDLQTNGLIRSSDLPNHLRFRRSDAADTETSVYRFLSDGPEPRWKGRLRRLMRALSASMATEIRLKQNQWTLQRNWQIHASQVAAETLPIQVPLEWLETDELTGQLKLVDSVTIRCDGRPSVVEVTSVSEDGFAKVESTDLPLVSPFEIEILARGDIVLPSNGAKDDFIALTIPLPRLVTKPTPAVFVEKSLLKVEEGLVCRWKQAGFQDTYCTVQDGPVELPISDSSNEFDAEVSFVATSLRQTVIDQAWVQSIVNGRDRRDRCVFRVRGKLSDVLFRLPKNWSASSVTALVNGQRATIDKEGISETYRLRVPEKSSPIVNTSPQGVDQLVDSPSGGPMVFEFFHWQSQPNGWLPSLSLQMPSFEWPSESTDFVWQVVVPSDQYLWTKSPGLLPFHRWAWKNFGWQRSVSVNQAELEQKSGATKQAPVPETTNVYAFTTIAPISSGAVAFRHDIYLIPRYLLWLPVAALALVLTAIWPQVGLVRHPWSLLAIAIFLTLLAMWAPDMAMILKQAPFVSLFVVVLIKTLQWSFSYRGHHRSIFAGRAMTSTGTRPSTPTAQSESPRTDLAPTINPPLPTSGSTTQSVEPAPIQSPISST